MKTVGYIRVSSEGQNIARQKKSLKEAGCTDFFIEKISGASMDRPELQRMLKELEAGDTVITHEISRLSRSTKDLLTIVEIIQSKGAGLKSISDKWLDLSDDNPMSEFIFTIFSGLAQFERKMIKQRQKEGIEIAKSEGKFKGRKTKLVEGGKEEQRMKAIIEAYNKGKSINDIRTTFKVGTGTIYRLLEREGLKG
ncbi:recombinase family protein [Peribacillus frigoritolerans]|uniref:recombinase family protein n=1 Tax=Peribacillus frigoritolerans TaxID=450367 RepID=UPI0023DBB2FA|nr:recombinase family protein [Peribacillus frigoritolerans]MDF1999480.1 recombinase family protein [Peribacillus frigoritolerans]